MFVVALGTLLMALAAPALATAEEETGGDAPAETSIDVPAPAVSIPDEAAAEPNPEWTFRFLLPMTLLLGAVVVVGTIVAYFAKVTRQRYRIVK